MNDDFSLRDIEKVDRALYEVIDAIIYVSVETLWGTREGDDTTSKFTVKQIGEIASFLEGQLNNNERFRLQYWDIAKYLFIERSGYVYIVMNFILIQIKLSVHYTYVNVVDRFLYKGR